MNSPEKLQEALDLIAKGVVQPTKIAKAIGVPYRTYRSWMVRSNAGDEKFLVEVDGQVMQWAKAITQARRLAMFELRGMLEQYSIFGTEELSYKDGQVVWALDPGACAPRKKIANFSAIARTGYLKSMARCSRSR
jgi:hypothetical protein